MLSKLCSAFKKPRAQTVLRTSAVAGFLRPMKFQKVSLASLRTIFTSQADRQPFFLQIRFLGGKLGDTIAAEYGAETVGDLLCVFLTCSTQKANPDAQSSSGSFLCGRCRPSLVRTASGSSTS